MTLSKLSKAKDGVFVCPKCGGNLICLSGGQVRIVNGRVDYDNVKPKYVCLQCGEFYREVLNTGYFDVFSALEEDLANAKKESDFTGKKHKKVIKKTGDLAPVQLRHDARNQAKCPRCGAKMRYLEPEPAKIVNGRADFSDTVARFRCDECDSLYRQIASTDYYQWSEK